MSITRDRLLELLLKAAESIEKHDQDLKLKFGVVSDVMKQPFVTYEIRQFDPSVHYPTWADVLIALRTTSESLERDKRPEEDIV